MRAREDSLRLSELGPWALIAGGSEGVGESFARQLAAAGLDLVLVARNPARLDALAGELRDQGVEVRTLAQDLTAPDALEKVAAATADLEIGLLIYNAGANSDFAQFLDTSEADSLRLIALNVIGPTRFCRLFGDRMRQRRRGGIILLGSVSGYAGLALTSVYSATKAYIHVLAEGLWFELLPHGVHVLGLVLGGTRTPTVERLRRKYGAGESEQPAAHLSEPDAVARQGLEQIRNGPLFIAGGNEDFVHRLQRMPRFEAAGLISRRFEASGAR